MGITGAPFGRTELLVPPLEPQERDLARGKGPSMPEGWSAGPSAPKPPSPMTPSPFAKKVTKKVAQNESFFNFFPTPQPPNPSPQTPKDAPDHAGKVRQSFIPIGQNGTPVMPI